MLLLLLLLLLLLPLLLLLLLLLLNGLMLKLVLHVVRIMLMLLLVLLLHVMWLTVILLSAHVLCSELLLVARLVLHAWLVRQTLSLQLRDVMLLLARLLLDILPCRRPWQDVCLQLDCRRSIWAPTLAWVISAILRLHGLACPGALGLQQPSTDSDPSSHGPAHWHTPR